MRYYLIDLKLSLTSAYKKASILFHSDKNVHKFGENQALLTTIKEKLEAKKLQDNITLCQLMNAGRKARGGDPEKCNVKDCPFADTELIAPAISNQIRTNAVEDTGLVTLHAIVERANRDFHAGLRPPSRISKHRTMNKNSVNCVLCNFSKAIERGEQLTDELVCFDLFDEPTPAVTLVGFESMWLQELGAFIPSQPANTNRCTGTCDDVLDLPHTHTRTHYTPQLHTTTLE
jgi:hypothetical protein